MVAGDTLSSIKAEDFRCRIGTTVQNTLTRSSDGQMVIFTIFQVFQAVIDALANGKRVDLTVFILKIENYQHNLKVIQQRNEEVKYPFVKCNQRLDFT